MITDPTAALFNESVCSHLAKITGVADDVCGYYSREYVEVSMGRAQIVGYKPVFVCSTAAVSSVGEGTAVVIAGVGTFTVAIPEQIDATETRLVLREA